MSLSAVPRARLVAALEEVNRIRRGWVVSGAEMRDRLEQALRLLGVDTGTSDRGVAELAQAMEQALDGPSVRLAVYGTLAPGRPNHGVLGPTRGTWTPGTVRGHLRPVGWGFTEGYPAMLWDERGSRHELQLYESRDLPQHWRRLDLFEGSGYRRILVPVNTAAGVRVANLYEGAR